MFQIFEMQQTEHIVVEKNYSAKRIKDRASLQDMTWTELSFMLIHPTAGPERNQDVPHTMPGQAASVARSRMNVTLY